MKVLRSLRTVVAMFTMLALVVTGCGGAKSLALRIKQGDQVQYHVVMDMDMNMTVSANGQTIPANKATTRMEYDAALVFDKVTAEEAAVTYALNNFKGEMEMQGQKRAMPGMPADLKMTMTINPKTGELIDITGLPQLGEGAGLSKEQLRDMLKEAITQLPATGEAKVGDSWDLEVKMPLELPGMTNNSVIKSTIKYEANESKDGVQVAKLSTTASGPLDITMEQGPVKLAMKGTMESTGVQYVDLKTGLPHSAESDATMTIKSEGAGENGQAFHMEVTTTVHMVMTRK